MQKNSDYIVLYDAQNHELFEQSVLPLLEEGWRKVAFQSLDDLNLAPESTVLLWLGDEALSALVPYAVQQGWAVGFLPHPDMKLLYRSIPVAKDLKQAMLDIRSAQTPVLSDLLYCNGRLVLSSVMVGNSAIMSSAATMDKNIWSKLKYLISMTFNLSKVSLAPYKLETEKGTVVNTAALGITFVYRASASDFTKHLVNEQTVDTANLNSIVLAPRSISEVGRFLFSRLFPNRRADSALPNYIGHIKTPAIQLSAPAPISYTLDGDAYTDDEVVVSVERDALKVISQALPEQQSAEEIKESIRVSSLPKGQAVKELVNRPLPWIHHVDHEEVKETFVNLKENAQTSESFLVLMVLSTLLATVGLFANSAPVIIGAMILAPLMAPIISLSMGVLRQNIELISTASRTLAVGVLLALVFGVLLTLITPLQTVTNEIAARLSPTILDMGVAIIAGIAGAYASARSEVAKSLAGVAIAVALVPPLAVSGIGIGWLDWHTFSAAFLLFITNLVGIVLASTLTFLFMGFSPFHLAKKGVVIALGFVVVVSMPLTLSFAKLVDKQRIISELEGLNVASVELRDVQIKQLSPLYVSTTLVSPQNIDNQQVDTVKQHIEQRLKRKVVLESRVAILR